MPLPNLTDDEQAELVRLLRDAIAADRYFLAPRAKRLKSILAKLDPASTERTVTPYPAPRPSAEPSQPLPVQGLLLRDAKIAEGRRTTGRTI